MKVNVRYFAVVRERLRKDGETVDLPADATVAAALDALGERYPEVASLRPYLQVAVNQEAVGPETALSDGDELALIPPVAGGADAPPRLARIVSDRPLSLANVVEAVTGPGMGGVATFTGMVRDRSQGKQVVRLEYEAYAEMAEKVFRELMDEIEAEIPGARLAVEHRVGRLGVGDLAVVIAAAAPHRDEAFRACRALIDRLKTRAPIWKKEFSPDGASWVGLGP